MHSDNYMYFRVNDDERLRIDSSGRVLIDDAATAGPMEIFGSAVLQVATPAGGTLVLGRNDSSVSTDNGIGSIYFDVNDSTGNAWNETARITVNADGDHANNDYPSRMEFYTTAASANTPTERLRITSEGILRTPNLQGNNRREIHRHITGFNSGSNVVNYLIICQTDRTNVRLAGRLLTARASGTSACSSQLFDITFQTNHNASHRSGAIMGLHSGSSGYGHAEAEFVSLTYNSTNYYAIRFSDGWVTDFDTCSFDGIREHLGTNFSLY